MNRGTAIGVIFVAVIGVGVAMIVAATVGTSSDEYGRVSIPGQATLTLESDEVEVFYAERSQPDSLSPPADLEFLITEADGTPVAFERTSGTQLSSPSGTAVEVGEITGAEGLEVVVQTRGGQGRSRPELTLGRDPFEVVGETATDVATSPLTYMLGGGALALLIGIGSLRRLAGTVLRGGRDAASEGDDVRSSEDRVERRAAERAEARAAGVEADRAAGAGTNPEIEIDFSTGKPYKPGR